MNEPGETQRAHLERYRARVRGCLLGGALGDALGAPIEFASLQQIRAMRGSAARMLPYAGRPGTVTDDTQMTLFGLEGLIRSGLGRDPARVRRAPEAVHAAYLRWLTTQHEPAPPADTTGWLGRQQWLYARRAPGNACLSGLGSPGMGTLDAPKNPDSKGCGTVMRSAPFGLYLDGDPTRAFDLAVAGAVQSHGHPTGYLAAGALAAIVQQVVRGLGLRAAVHRTIALLQAYASNEETTRALRNALDAADRPTPPSAEVVEALGGGWVAEEALAIGLYCALAHPESMRDALLLAVEHSGDSDSTGSICGNLLGALLGDAALPPAWTAVLEGRDTIGMLAEDFVLDQLADLRDPTGESYALWSDRYPLEPG